ncbi:hypothetical protein Tco_0273626 [Tanacetum coccineum]
MEDEFYNLAVKGNDLKTYIRRFQELAVLCPNMVPNTEKLMEVFISGLPKSIEGNVTASKPQTLEEATNIAQRLMDQIIRHDSVQETNDHKRKLEDKGNIINNNYQNNYNNNNRNNDYHQQQNKKQETFRTYTATNRLRDVAVYYHFAISTFLVIEQLTARSGWDLKMTELLASATICKNRGVTKSEGEELEDQGRIIQDIDDDPLVSLVRESMKEKSTYFVTPTKASGEAQEEEISPTILEAAKTLSKVASQSVSKAKSTDKGKRYRRRARSMAKKINIGLDAEDEINVGRVEISTGIEDVNTGSTKVDTGRTSISTSSIIHSPKKGQRKGKA